jgi:hypothetical protein
MQRYPLLLTAAFLLFPCTLFGQIKAAAKKAPRKYGFVTLPMFTQAIAMPTREGALKAAFDVFKQWNANAAASLEIKCTVTKVHDVTFKTEQFPTLLPDGSNNFKASLTVPFKYSHVTWDAEITVKKDIKLSQVWFGREQLIDFHAISYFEQHLDKIFLDRVNKAIYKDNAFDTFVLKAGEKIKITSIHSIIAGEAKGNDWMCWVLRDDQHPENYKEDVITAKLTLKKATTLDAKSVTVDYEIKDAAVPSIHFDVYRSKVGVIPFLYNLTTGDDLVKLADTTLTDNNSLTKGVHDKVTVLSNIELTPDTRLPYIVVVATFNNKKQQIYFKKWMLGALAHGFDRFAMDDPFLVDVKSKIEELDKTNHQQKGADLFGSIIAKGWSFIAFSACRDYSLPTWEDNMANQLKNKDGYDYIIPFNWMETCAKEYHQYAVDAGFKLADMISTYIKDHTVNSGDVVDIHLIGHSRGTVVVTQALNVLMGKLNTSESPFGGSYVELTLLDPHPANNDLEPKDNSRPPGTSWASWGRKSEGNDDAIERRKKEMSTDCVEELDNFVTGSTKYSYNQLIDLISCLREASPDNNCSKLLAVSSFIYPELFSTAANESTIKFQLLVHDNPLSIPNGVKRIDIYYQHTRANQLFDQPDQEYIQNLWGMVSPTSLKVEDGALQVNKTDLTGVDIDGIGVIGHNQVPLVYEQLWVDTGTLNRSAETSNKNVKP